MRSRKNLIIIVIGMLGIISCKEKKIDLSEQKKAIIGTWYQFEPNCTDCDTLTFWANGIFRSNQENFDYSYEFLDESFIRINRGNSFVDDYMYQFSEANNKLIIEKYIIDLTGFQNLDIILIKIE
jgi:hypothetical protein